MYIHKYIYIERVTMTIELCINCLKTAALSNCHFRLNSCSNTWMNFPFEVLQKKKH